MAPTLALIHCPKLIQTKNIYPSFNSGLGRFFDCCWYRTVRSYLGRINDVISRDLPLNDSDGYLGIMEFHCKLSRINIRTVANYHEMIFEIAISQITKMCLNCYCSLARNQYIRISQFLIRKVNRVDGCSVEQERCRGSRSRINCWIMPWRGFIIFDIQFQ